MTTGVEDELLASLGVATLTIVFIISTIVSLSAHILGRHKSCRRNLAYVSMLAVLSLTTHILVKPSPPVQVFQTITLLTITLTPFALVATKLVEKNNMIYKSTTGFAATSRHINPLYELTEQPETTALDKYFPQPSRTSIYYTRETSNHPARHCSGECGTLTKPMDKTLEKPAQPIIQPSQTTRPRSKNTQGNTAQRPERKEKTSQKLSEIILSENYAGLLPKLVVKNLRQGVRYMGKTYTDHIGYLRIDDIRIIWFLARKRKLEITPRTEKRLIALRLVRRTPQGKLELTERGWVIRQAIEKSGLQIRDRRNGRNGSKPKQ